MEGHFKFLLDRLIVDWSKALTEVDDEQVGRSLEVPAPHEHVDDNKVADDGDEAHDGDDEREQRVPRIGEKLIPAVSDQQATRRTLYPPDASKKREGDFQDPVIVMESL